MNGGRRYRSSALIGVRAISRNVWEPMTPQLTLSSDTKVWYRPIRDAETLQRHHQDSRTSVRCLCVTLSPELVLLTYLNGSCRVQHAACSCICGCAMTTFREREKSSHVFAVAQELLIVRPQAATQLSVVCLRNGKQTTDSLDIWVSDRMCCHNAVNVLSVS